jgi:hypothetical protein
MKNNRGFKNRIFLLSSVLFLSLYNHQMFGQAYRWEATMEDSVTQDGFYNIVLKPEIGAKLKSDLSDIRILDADNYQVPFVQKSEEPYFVGERFKEYPIVSKQIIDHCCTKLTIKNPGKKPINNICLILKNSDAIKVMRLAGSDDGVNWYGVKRYDVFYNAYSETDTKVVNYINFAVTDYLYYRLEIIDRGYWDEDRWSYWYEDRWSYPVNILKVGYYETYLKEGKYSKVPVPEFAQADSTAKKKTYIKINFDDNYLINRIRFELKGPRYYKRHASIAKKIEDKKRKEAYYETLASVELNSYSLNEFDLDYFREKEVYMIIDNDDNRPLDLKSISVWQLTKYLKTYLQKGQRYRLVYGDSAAVAPVYDLRYFVDSIPQILPTLPVASIEAKKIESREIKNQKAKEAARVPRWFEDKMFIWLAIALVTLFLFFMSWKMLNEMKKTNS